MKSRFVPNLNSIPSGSGIDNVWQVDEKRDCYVFYNCYSGMNKAGMYDGEADFSVKVPGLQPENFSIRFHGKGFQHKSWFYELRDYLYDIFSEWVATCTLEEPTYVYESDFGDTTYKLGFPVANTGVLVYVYAAQDEYDALETVGKAVWKKGTRNAPKILRADKACQELMEEYGGDDGQYFAVNGGEHYIDSPSIIEEL